MPHDLATSEIFTTGDIARHLRAAPRSVGKWIDAGLLPGYRLPGSGDRRVTRAALIKFLADNNMPQLPALSEAND